MADTDILNDHLIVTRKLTQTTKEVSMRIIVNPDAPIEARLIYELVYKASPASPRPISIQIMESAAALLLRLEALLPT